jgi:hypothetical protein
LVSIYKSLFTLRPSGLSTKNFLISANLSYPASKFDPPSIYNALILREGWGKIGDDTGLKLKADLNECDQLRNPFFLDRVSGFDWTVIPILSGQLFSFFLPA